MKKRRFIIFLLLLAFTVPYYTCKAAVYPQVLTLSQAVSSAVNTSYEVRKARNDMQLKSIELKQAIQAIKDIRKKENTIQFSLLFNIKFPQQHALPKELELVMKVPKIQSELKDLERKIENKKLSAIMSAKLAYFNVVEIMETCTLLENRIASAKATYLRLSNDYIAGKASKDDVEEVKNSISAYEKDYQSSLIRFENAKSKLSDCTGIDVSNGYTFSKDFSRLQLERSRLNEITQYALKNDYKIYQSELASKIANTEVETLRNIYNSRWGTMVSVIENELSKNGPIDFETFKTRYESALDNIESPYVGYYTIPILFIVLKIPKEWFRSELSGIRYFEDQKYALYISLMDREAAQKEEAQARKALTSQVEDEFNGLMELWSAYQDSLAGLDRAKLQYDRVRKLNLTGNASFMDMESAKNDVLSYENTILSALIAYNKTLASFDFTTAGAISKLLSGVSLAPAGEYGSGISWLSEEAGGSKPSWYLNTLIEEYKFVFGISIPEDSGVDATHYELCTENGNIIGTRTGINQVISHIPLVYQGTTKLIVRLYKEDKLKYISEIDAADYTGTLDLKPVDPSVEIPVKALLSPGTLIGSWSLVKNKDNYTSRFTLTPDKKWKIGYYELETSSGERIGDEKIPIDTSISHLSIIFSSPGSLAVKLYDTEGNSLGEAVIADDMDIKTVKMK